MVRSLEDIVLGALWGVIVVADIMKECGGTAGMLVREMNLYCSKIDLTKLSLEFGIS